MFTHKQEAFEKCWAHSPLSEYRRDLWRQATRVPELSCSIICVILCLAILIQYRSVTDTHADTWRRHILC